MKTTLRILCAALAAVLLCSAAYAQMPPPSLQAKPLPVIPDGMLALPVQSAVDENGQGVAVLFDGKVDTGVTVGEEKRSFTLRTATGLPFVLSAFAAVTTAEKGTLLTVKVWGTNDNLENEWTPLTLTFPVVKTGDWRVFSLSKPEGGWGKAEKYAFYKIEISLTEGTEFTLSECLLIMPDLGEPLMTFGYAEVVEEGQTPPVVPVEETPAETLPRRLRFGLFYPGWMK